MWWARTTPSFVADLQTVVRQSWLSVITFVTNRNVCTTLHIGVISYFDESWHKIWRMMPLRLRDSCGDVTCFYVFLRVFTKKLPRVSLSLSVTHLSVCVSEYRNSNLKVVVGIYAKISPWFEIFLKPDENERLSYEFISRTGYLGLRQTR
jgi:hypothetical protein